jgi:nicotinamidase-related amidase
MHDARPRASEKPRTPPDLHGNAPDQCAVALMLVDVINDLEFPGAAQLQRSAEPAARALAALRVRATRAGVPCIYANDNFGRWRSDFWAQVRHVREDDTRGARLAEILTPSADDYFVLKPKHSAFYQTCLDLLLEHLGTKTLVLGGFSTDSCVHLTAGDAFLRGLEVVVLRDGTASQSVDSHRAALKQMEQVLHARTPRCADVSFVRGPSGVGLRLRKPRARG